MEKETKGKRILFPSEYQQEFTRKEQEKVKLCKPADDFAEKIEDWQIDLNQTSELLSMEEKLELIKMLDRKYNTTVYQHFFKNPVAKNDIKEKSFARELLLYIQNLYFDPHNEKVLAPPVTSKRVYGYITPKLLHAQLSTYQHTHGRVAGEVMLKNTNPN